MNVDEEIERSLSYLFALIDVRFSMAKGQRGGIVNPQSHYLWRNREEFEREPGTMFMEGVRLHNDRTWSWQPCTGSRAALDRETIMFRHYRTIYGHRHSVTEWNMVTPSCFQAEHP